MTAGVLRLVSADGRQVQMPFGAGELPAAERVRDLFRAEESVRVGRRRVEIVVEGGDAA
ncbi:hypothetical protein [Micromonospora sp. NPDC050695]|uniref:hypothetical protein n=1 Tax=Micromonospora sp. NPDC050695 TaxID=3154938 RepID=UPI00340E8037